jgi:hypothetical protein
MVILTDITDKKALQYKMEEEKATLKMVVIPFRQYACSPGYSAKVILRT